MQSRPSLSWNASRNSSLQLHDFRDFRTTVLVSCLKCDSWTDLMMAVSADCLFFASREANENGSGLPLDLSFCCNHSLQHVTATQHSSSSQTNDNNTRTFLSQDLPVLAIQEHRVKLGWSPPCYHLGCKLSKLVWSFHLLVSFKSFWSAIRLILPQKLWTALSMVAISSLTLKSLWDVICCPPFSIDWVLNHHEWQTIDYRSLKPFAATVNVMEDYHTVEYWLLLTWTLHSE